jgi:hypothetical protein
MEERIMPGHSETFADFTRYIGTLDKCVDISGNEMLNLPQDEGLDSIRRQLNDFKKTFMSFMDKYLDIEPNEYNQMLRKEDKEAIIETHLLLKITEFVQSDDLLMKSWQDGELLASLKRLKELDWRKIGKRIVRLTYTSDREFGEPEKVMIDLKNYQYQVGDDEKISMSARTVANVYQTLADLHVEFWNSEYNNSQTVSDYENWIATVTYNDGTEYEYEGENSYPINFSEYQKLFSKINQY